MSKVSIIIRCYNEEEHIGRLLSGILQQTVKDVEIILVDSGSTDATLSIACRYPMCVLHISPKEFSFGRSLNKGCAAAHGDLLVFASAHVYPLYEDWLEKLIDPLELDPKVALSYGGQRGDERTKYSEHQVFAHWFPPEADYDQGHPFCNNANAVVRRKLWERFPYDEQVTGLEDLDWARRVTAQGYKIAYAAEAVIVHVHNETPRRIYNRYHREAIAHKLIFPDQRFSSTDFVRLFATNVASDLYHARRDRVLLGNSKSIFTFRLMQFWGTYKGFRQHGTISRQLKQTFYYPRGLSRTTPNPDPAGSRALIKYEH
ncbi:MAG: glycosyltransferase family 2 protein [Chloroflexia bacterium]